MAQKQYTGPLIPRIRSVDGFSHVSGESQNMVYHEGRKMAAHVLDEMEQLGTSWASRQYETTDGTVIRTHASRAPGQQPMVYVEAVVQPAPGEDQRFDSDEETLSPREQVLGLTFVPPLFVVGNQPHEDLHCVLEPNEDVPIADDLVLDSAHGWRVAKKPAYVPEGRFGLRCTSNGTDDPRFVVTGVEESEDDKGVFNIFGYGGAPVGKRPGGAHYYIDGVLVAVEGDCPDVAGMDRTGRRGLSRLIWFGSRHLPDTQYLLEVDAINGPTASYSIIDEVETSETLESRSYTHNQEPDVWDCDPNIFQDTAFYNYRGRSVSVTWEAHSSDCTVLSGPITVRDNDHKYIIKGFINWDFDPSTNYEYQPTRRRYNRDEFAETARSFGSTYSVREQSLSIIMYGYWASVEYTIDRYSTGGAGVENKNTVYDDGVLSFADNVWALTGYEWSYHYKWYGPIKRGTHDLGSTRLIGTYLPDEVTLGFGCSVDWNCPTETITPSRSSETETITPGHEYDVYFIEPRLKAYVLFEYTVDGYDEVRYYEPVKIYILNELVLTVPYEDYRRAKAFVVTADACGVIQVDLRDDGIRWFGVFADAVSEITNLYTTLSDRAASGSDILLLGALRGLAETPEAGFPTVSLLYSET